LRWVADERSFGKAENEMPSRSKYCRFGADLPKNLSGRTGSASMWDERKIPVSAGNGSCMTSVKLFNK